MRLEGSVVALAGVLPYILLTLQWLVSYVRQPQAAPPLPRTPAPPSEEVIAASQDTPVIVANDPLPRHDQVYGE
jgi:hypothetical protein